MVVKREKRESVETRLLRNVDESLTVRQLFRVLESKGGFYQRFGEEIQNFFANLGLRREYRDSSIRPTIDASLSLSYVNLIDIQRENPRDELIQAAMEYLGARYPQVAKDSSLLYGRLNGSEKVEAGKVA
jgi:hypothetical protein